MIYVVFRFRWNFGEAQDRERPAARKGVWQSPLAAVELAGPLAAVAVDEFPAH
jgi:hypothetical protein